MLAPVVLAVAGLLHAALLGVLSPLVAGALLMVVVAGAPAPRRGAADGASLVMARVS